MCYCFLNLGVLLSSLRCELLLFSWDGISFCHVPSWTLLFFASAFPNNELFHRPLAASPLHLTVWSANLLHERHAITRGIRCLQQTCLLLETEWANQMYLFLAQCGTPGDGQGRFLQPD